MIATRLILIAAGLAAGSATAALRGAYVEPPVISKPRPVPTVPGSVLPLPPAKYDPSLQVGGSDIKARKVDTRLGVDVRINDRGPYRFIVDSGADSSVIGVSLARQLELPLGTPATLHGMTGTTLVDRVKVASLTVGATTVHDLQLPALSEENVGSAGLIGLDALVEQRLMLDFEKRLIKVEDGRVPIKALPGEIVVVARRRRGQLIMTGVRAADQRLDAIIDTGSEVTIGNLALRDRLVRKKRATLRTIDMIGVTGTPIKIELAVISDLEVGPILLRDVPIAFVDAPPFALFGLAKQPAMLLGTDLMEQFRRVSLDFRARRVRFQLRRCVSEGITISTNPDRVTRIQGVGGNQACQD
ncbi:aspartyl protease family protein [Sphingomonas sp. KRR8]|uniref:aspartyl protease family protein n=1 Tax=Sphingomonas sp. KRR8 TaxID=2942996 RepID=UPI0020221EAA|nr:aspartyl protease family protein [Sphingomonas sp. KRR8]URD59735.1 aspartyl protease family protein [Sphingomonas sp. KRR8]